MSETARRLVLLRHAKAMPPAGSADHERPLAPSGRADARAMGQWLKEQRIQPDLVLCSTSVRTRETWEEVADAGGIGALIEHEGQAYNASVMALLELLRLVESAAHTVVLVGHAPGIPGLAAALSDGQPGAEALDAGFSTCTAAVVSVPVDWADLAAGTTSVETVHTARASEN